MLHTMFLIVSLLNQQSDDVVVIQVENSCVDKLNIYVGTGLTGRFEKFQMVYDEQNSCFTFTIPPTIPENT